MNISDTNHNEESNTIIGSSKVLLQVVKTCSDSRSEYLIKDIIRLAELKELLSEKIF
jgi:hypothetical protein